MATVTNRDRQDSYLILLWLPLLGALLSALVIYLYCGSYGVVLLWVNWSPAVVGLIVFVALFAILSLCILLRRICRFVLGKFPASREGGGSDYVVSDAAIETKKQNKS